MGMSIPPVVDAQWSSLMIIFPVLSLRIGPKNASMHS
jgi:hypothetical protein